jgi:REP element-mobilizing transposase RayT
MEHTHLHHIDLPNHYQFVTFRTHDSVDGYLKKISSSTIPENKKQQELDNHLDKSLNGAYLKHNILNLLHHFIMSKNKDYYDLVAFCIMPNHIHMLIKPRMKLSLVIKNLKGASGFLINKELNQKGTFWADGYFDKLIRDEEHFNIVYNYIKNNPRNVTPVEGELPRFYGVYD